MAAQPDCQRAKLTADDGARDDLFGCSVAVSGDVVIVGAHRHDITGAAYVFERSGNVWEFAAKLVNEGLPGAAHIGRSVGVDGNFAVVGATGKPGIFERSEVGWSQVAQLRPHDPDPDSLFGFAVALSAEVAMVGAPQDDDNGFWSGSAYVFERDPNGTWPQVAKLLPDDGDGGDQFGYALAISGNVAVMGTPDDEEQGNYSGSAYVFERDPNGDWFQAAKLLASDGRPFSGYGYHVAAGADVVMVGAADAHGNENHTGAVYVYERDPNGAWPEVVKLTTSDGQIGDGFGCSIALSAGIAVIAAAADDDVGEGAGSAYVFVRQGVGTWSKLAKLVPDDGAPYDRFGSGAGVSGNVAGIGAFWDDDHGEDSGSAYVFAVGPDEDGNGVMDVCECIGDLDHDYDVDLADLAQLLSNYGMTEGAVYEDGDLDEDGDVDLADLAALLANYGMTCP